MDYFELVSVPIITMAVYWIINLLKYSLKLNPKFMRIIPIFASFLGAIMGLVLFYTAPDLMPVKHIVTAIIVGGASGLSATGANQMFWQLKSKKNNVDVIKKDNNLEDNDAAKDNTDKINNKQNSKINKNQISNVEKRNTELSRKTDFGNNNNNNKSSKSILNKQNNNLQKTIFANKNFMQPDNKSNSYGMLKGGRIAEKLVSRVDNGKKDNQATIDLTEYNEKIIAASVSKSQM